MLPQTILDAFTVTRNLGFEFIWIDSLCIIQDDVDDVNQELSKMRHIYQNAVLTISASRAASAQDGFLGQDFRPLKLFSIPPLPDEVQVPFVVSNNWFLTDVFVSRPLPVNARGWTLQEIFFPPRVLLFTDLQVFWKCQTCFRVDGYSGIDWDSWAWKTGFPRNTFKTSGKAGLLGWLWNWRRSEKEMHDLRAQWRSLLITFTERKLSVEKDKLIAISAIAESFAEALDSDYLAGLWRKYLLWDLLWRIEGPGQRVTTWRSPSWSWASLNGVVHLELDPDDIRPLAEIVECSTQPAVEALPFGAVTSGEIWIRGYLRQVQFTYKLQEWTIVDKNPSPPRWVGSEHPEFHCDDASDMEALSGDSGVVTAWCLVLGGVPLDWGGLHVSCLVLVKLDTSPDCYRRVGLYWAKLIPEFQPHRFEEGEQVVVKIV
jgi:hypothetical protein